MAEHRPVKGVALYTNRERELWEEAEREARETLGHSSREGEVFAHICATYLKEE